LPDLQHNPDLLPTPCTGVCAIGDDGLCGGCLRTLDEVVRWSRMSPEERARVMAELPTRASDD